MSRRALAVLHRLYRHPDECVALAMGPERTIYLRVTDSLTVEAVEQHGPQVTERYQVAVERASQLIDSATDVTWHPVGQFVGTCDPRDRPVIEH